MNRHNWQQQTLSAQLGNIGAEIGRCINWRKQPQFGDSQTAFLRALEYLDLTITDPRHHGSRRRELCRLREVLVDWHYGSHLYHTQDAAWASYFNPFAIRANRHLPA